MVESGVKELNLIAEDTNQYGQDRRDGKGLAQLMHELGKLEGLQWMRILYAYPSYFTDDLIDEIASNPKVSSTLQLSSCCMPFDVKVMPELCAEPLLLLPTYPVPGHGPPLSLAVMLPHKHRVDTWCLLHCNMQTLTAVLTSHQAQVIIT